MRSRREFQAQLVERWFKEPTDKRRVRRGVFTTVDNLTQAVTVRTEHWKSDPKPVGGKATTDDITKKASPGREALHQIKSSNGSLGLPRCGK